MVCEVAESRLSNQIVATGQNFPLPAGEERMAVDPAVRSAAAHMRAWQETAAIVGWGTVDCLDAFVPPHFA